MTSRERLLAVLAGNIPDSVPVSLFVQEEFLNYMYPGNEADRVSGAVECAEYFDFDVMTRSKAFTTPYYMRKSGLNWEASFTTKREAGNYYEIFEITTPLKTLRQIEAGPDIGAGVKGLHLSTMEYLIKDESDLEAFIKYVPSIDRDTIEKMKEYCSWSKKVIGNRGISVPWGMGGIYNQAATFRNVSDLMMDPYINEDFYSAYMEKITELTVEFDSCLAQANGDAVGIQGNIANAAMVGSSFFDEYILPYEKRLADAIKASGSYTVYHNCGKAEVLQESYVKMGLTAWETVAAHPQGDNTLEGAKAKVGDRITLIGNLDQVDFIKRATPEEVEEAVTKIVNTGKPGGRYIFACSDYLEKGTPLENVSAAVRAARRVGGY